MGQTGHRQRVSSAGTAGQRWAGRSSPQALLGSGRLCASWESLAGPSAPSPVAAQFTSEGATLSGVDLELVGSGYRMSLVKRRFATGTRLPCAQAGPCQAPERVPHLLLPGCREEWAGGGV